MFGIERMAQPDQKAMSWFKVVPFLERGCNFQRVANRQHNAGRNFGRLQDLEPEGKDSAKAGILESKQIRSAKFSIQE